MSPSDLEKEIAIELQLEKIRLANYRLDSFAPNPKQWAFCAAGGPGRPEHEILLSGPNQAGGKTYTLQYLTTVHATGRYPPEWEGPRFTKPPHLGVACETASITRDQIYFGTQDDPASLFGPGGWMPTDCYDPETDLVSLRGNYENLLDYATIDWHDANGVKRGKSTVRFFGYAKGWKKMQGFKFDGILLNEMPPDPVYNEMRARINKTMGYIWVAACPLGGETQTYLLFERDKSGMLMLITYTIDDCTHLSKQEYDFIFNRWKDHPEAEARLYGRPCRGSGVIYGYPRAQIVEPTYHVGDLEPQLIGLDFSHGTGTFAALRGAHQVQGDVLHIVDEYKAANLDTPIYIERVKTMGGASIPCAWPHDGGRAFGTTTSGGTVAEHYRKAGLRMMKQSAFVYDDEGRKVRTVMTAIQMVQDRLATGRLRISQNCTQLLEEMRLYRHKDGKVLAKQDDHLIDALHKMVMMLRYAKPASKGDIGPPRGRGFPVPRTTRGEYNFFGG